MDARRAVVSLLLVGCACSLPPVELAAERPLPLRTTITASDGSFLARLYRQNRALMPIDRAPQHLIDAVLAAEDARFFDHPGYDIRAIARAALVNISRGEVLQGGSTITQQYVKNTFLSRPGRAAPRTVKRKAKELRYAIEIERQYSKEEILERYLNTVYMGEGAYGIKAGAETFFRHGAGRLSLRESALLAAVIRAPARYDPRENPDRATARRNYVLDRMATLGLIRRREANRVAGKGLGVAKVPPRLPTRQPYFVEAVKREVLRDLRLGTGEVERANALWKGGLRIVTTLDPKLQAAAETAVRTQLSLEGDPHAALVAIRPRTGEVVAMVGGRSWSQSQVNLALGRAGGGSGRQAGSAFKTIATAAALESGLHLYDVFDASPATFRLPDGSTWTVHNSEGTARGNLPLNEALVYSVNGVFARLAIEIGPGAIATQAELMGIRSDLGEYPSIALGTSEVSVLEMAAAYATLANAGTAVEPTTVRQIRTSDGDVFKPEQEITPGAMQPGNAYLLTRVLQDVIRRGTGEAAQLGRPVAGKTGTTDDHADAWFVGYTRNLVTAVWVGHPQGRVPMTNVHGTRVWGGNIPAYIFRSFMAAAHEGKPVRGFEIPQEDIVTVEIDPVSGLLAAPWCPGKPKTLLRQLAPTEVCPSPEATPTDGGTPSPSPSLGGRPGAGGASGEETPAPTPSPSR